MTSGKTLDPICDMIVDLTDAMQAAPVDAGICEAAEAHETKTT